MAKVTVVTITVHHDRMTREENRLFDTFVSPEYLVIDGSVAHVHLIEALVSKQAEVTLEIREV